MAKIVYLRLLVVLLLPVLGYSAVMVLYWYQVRGAVDQVITDIAPYAMVRYDSLSASSSGIVDLDGLVIRPAGSTSYISAGRLRIITSGWQYLLEAGEELAEGRWPQAVDLELSGIDFELNPEIVRRIDNQIAQVVPQSELARLLAMACGGHKPLSLQQVNEAGIDRLAGDLLLGYRLDPVSKQVSFTADMQATDMFDVAMDVQLLVASEELSSQMFTAYSPRLQSASLAYTDLGYHRKRNEYCANLNDANVDLYNKNHRERVVQFLADKGWKPDRADGSSYQSLMAAGGSLELSLLSEKPLPLRKALFSPEQLVNPLEDLNIQLTLNRRSIDLLAMRSKSRLSTSISEAAVAAIELQTVLQAPGAGKDADEPTLRRAKTRAALELAIQSKTAITVDPRSFKEVALGDIDKFVGKQVRLETYYGRKVAGTLIKIQGNKLYVSQHVEQGSASYPIDKTKVADLHVFY